MTTHVFLIALSVILAAFALVRDELKSGTVLIWAAIWALLLARAW